MNLELATNCLLATEFEKRSPQYGVGVRCDARLSVISSVPPLSILNSHLTSRDIPLIRPSNEWEVTFGLLCIYQISKQETSLFISGQDDRPAGHC